MAQREELKELGEAEEGVFCKMSMEKSTKPKFYFNIREAVRAAIPAIAVSLVSQ
jgi:hypothetical protein